MINLSIDNILTKAKKFEKRGKILEAGELYFQIVKKFPKNKRIIEKLIEIHRILTISHVNDLRILLNNKEFEKIIINTMQLINKYSYSLELYKILGISLNASFKYNEAINVFNKIIYFDPKSYEACFNLGISYQSLEKYPQAINSYYSAINIKPDHYPSLNNLAVAQKKIGNFNDAIHNYNQVIKYHPYNPQVYNSMGVLYKEIGNFNLAIENYNKSIDIDKNYYKAYYNLGIIYNQIGNYEQSRINYQNAVNIFPNYFQAFNNMGTNELSMNNIENALNCFTKALSINPDYVDALYNIGDLLRSINFNRQNSKILNLINTLLEKKYIIRPYEIANTALGLMKYEDDYQVLFKKYTSLKLHGDLFVIIKKVTKTNILLKLMSNCPIANLDLEKFLEHIRNDLLDKVHNKEFSINTLNFQSALSQQCFINEYIYETNNSEINKINKLEKIVNQLLSHGKQPKPQFIFCLSAYKPLNKYKWCSLLKNNKFINDVYTQQIIEVNEENKIKCNIQTLDNISDKISSKVQEQYELNPYPKWINLGIPKEAISISELTLKLNVKDKSINKIISPLILIAGCGTGQHSIFEAKRFKNSNVIAIDLSSSSLAYAIRKTNELKITNLKYLQADILNLKKLEDKFDIIESVGVLHHMKNPIDGWQILTDRLKKGGLFRLGLYSKIARRHIVEIRNRIKKLNVEPNDLSMKKFRKIMIESNEVSHDLVKTSADFYSLSTLRDLLFHVQEHRFTLIEIKEMLLKLGLEFCGFEDEKLILDFKKSFSETDDKYDLTKWDLYEKQNPNAFINMYQFWCQKI